MIETSFESIAFLFEENKQDVDVRRAIDSCVNDIVVSIQNTVRDQMTTKFPSHIRDY